jgi:hypothetical protein
MRVLAARWFFCGFLFAGAGALPAAQFGDFTYNSTGTNITILRYKGPGGDVRIPDTINGLPVASLDHWVFDWYPKLTRVSIPASVTDIGVFAFNFCPDLTAIDVDLANPAYCSLDGVVFNKAQTRLIRYPGGKQGAYRIPDTVTAIQTSAFCGCVWLSEAMIPNTVTSIEQAAFNACSRLLNVVLPGNSLTNISDHAFYACASLTNVIIPASVTTIGQSAFSDCNRLTAIEVDPLNPAYSSLDGVLFDRSQSNLIQCPGATAGAYQVTEGVVSIGSDAFNGCTNLSSVVISQTVTNTSGAFQDTPGLMRIEVSPLNPAYSSLDGVLFDKSQTTLIQCPQGRKGTYIIPEGVTTLTDDSFTHCSQLTSVTIPETVTSLGWSTFSDCTGLTSIAIPKNVTNLFGPTFMRCSNLTSVRIPDSVTVMQRYTFAYCVRLTNVNIGLGLTNISSDVFDQCPSLAAIHVDSRNPAYSSLDGLLFNKSKTDLVLCPAGKPGACLIPRSVTSIDLGAFAEYAILKHLYFQGNAPRYSDWASTFGGGNRVTIHYLAGTTGWGPIYLGQPTALWMGPAALEGSLSIDGAGFGFNVAWAPDTTVVVEASPSFIGASWSPVSTNLLSGGLSRFSDSEWRNQPERFYRLRVQ